METLLPIWIIGAFLIYAIIDLIRTPTASAPSTRQSWIEDPAAFPSLDGNPAR